MKKKIIIISSIFLVVGAATAAGVVLGVQKNNTKQQLINKITPDDIAKPNDIAKKTTANYDKKEQVEASKAIAANIKFKGFDENIYKASVKKIMVSNTDLDTINVTFRLLEIEKNIESDDTIISIKGFKLPAKNPVSTDNPKTPVDKENLIPKPPTPTVPKTKTKEQLNLELEKITVDIKIDKTKIEANNLDVLDIGFANVPDKIEVIISFVKSKLSDDSTIIVTFFVKEENGSIKSDLKTVEVSGFKRPDEKIQQLNEILKEVNPVFKGNKTITDLSNPKSIDVSYTNVTKEISVITLTKEVKKEEPTTLIVKFKLRSLNENIESFIKEVEIKGFRKMFLSSDQLNVILKDVIPYVEGDKSKIDLSNLSNIEFKYKGQPADIEVLTVSGSVKKNDPTTVIHTFLVKEKNSKIKSLLKTVEIGGFKSPRLTYGEFNALINKINVLFEGDKSKTDLRDLNKIEIKYSGGNDEVSIITVSKTRKPNDPTTLLVSFKIKEKAGSLESSVRSVEISGFKKPPLTKVELDTLINLVTAFYDGDKTKTNLKNLDAIKINYKGQPENIEIITVNKTLKLGDPSTLVVYFKIKEKNEQAESVLKTIEISGFKKQD